MSTLAPAWDLLEPAGVRVQIRPDATPVVKICGELDIYSAPQLRDELLRVVRRHGPRLSLDLQDVTFLDCAGVTVLLATRRRARLEDGWVQISQASSQARRTISLLGLREVFELGASALREPIGIARINSRRGGDFSPSGRRRVALALRRALCGSVPDPDKGGVHERFRADRRLAAAGSGAEEFR